MYPDSISGLIPRHRLLRRETRSRRHSPGPLAATWRRCTRPGRGIPRACTPRGTPTSGDRSTPLRPRSGRSQNETSVSNGSFASFSNHCEDLPRLIDRMNNSIRWPTCIIKNISVPLAALAPAFAGATGAAQPSSKVIDAHLAVQATIRSYQVSFLVFRGRLRE